MNEMKRCPCCGAKVVAKFPYLMYLDKGGLWTFSHHCDHEPDDLTVGISVWGKTKEEIIERWNIRAEV